MEQALNQTAEQPAAVSDIPEGATIFDLAESVNLSPFDTDGPEPEGVAADQPGDSPEGGAEATEAPDDGGDSTSEESPDEEGDAAEDTPASNQLGISHELREFLDSNPKLSLDELAREGVNHIQFAQYLESGPEQAAEGISRLIAAAKDRYGDGFELDEVSIGALQTDSPEDWTPVERALHGRNKALAGMVDDLAKQVKELKAQRVAEANLPKIRAAVRAAYPDADVDAPELSQFMAEKRIWDPVVAYKAFAFDKKSETKAQAVAAAKAAQDRAPKEPPKATDSPFFNPKGLSPAEIIKLVSQGKTPQVS